MNYTLIENHQIIRQRFIDQFIASFSQFQRLYKDWVLRRGAVFTEAYYDRMYMWDRLNCEAQEISFHDAVQRLKEMSQAVLFMTESPNCIVREFCKLNNREEYVAAASAAELAECASYEWYAEYELAEQGCYLADPILPSDLYVFDDSFAWCMILTHETDETETADSRVCFLIGDLPT